MPKPESYPFLRIAKQYNVDYSAVLLAAQASEKEDYECNQHELKALEKIDKVDIRNTMHEFNLWQAIANAKREFKAVQDGKIDWITGEAK